MVVWSSSWPLGGDTFGIGRHVHGQRLAPAHSAYIVSRLTPVPTLHPIQICCAGSSFEYHVLIAFRRCSRDRTVVTDPRDYHGNHVLCLQAF
jgi:hypothetical protein